MSPGRQPQGGVYDIIEKSICGKLSLINSFDQEVNMKHERGTLEVICGSMFSGKTEELIRRLRRATIARQQVQVFKPAIDNRYKEEKVTSHSGADFAARPIERANEIIDRLDHSTTVVGIDEAQFFDESIVEVAQSLADRGLRVIVAGLDTDFRGEPFGMVPTLMAIAEDVSKLHAICMICGGLANRTQRLVNGKPAHYRDPIVIVGASEMYEARCRQHHQVPRD
jgi:thymidine kinase